MFGGCGGVSSGCGLLFPGCDGAIAGSVVPSPVLADRITSPVRSCIHRWQFQWKSSKEPVGEAIGGCGRALPGAVKRTPVAVVRFLVVVSTEFGVCIGS